MVTQSVRIPGDLAERLKSLAESTRLETALARFRDPDVEWVDHEEVGRELDLD